jgi:hypothetical protein
MIPNGRVVPLPARTFVLVGAAAHSRRVRYTYANHLGLYSEEISSTGEHQDLPCSAAESPPITQGEIPRG